MCTPATCMIVKAIPRIAQTLNAGPNSWNAIGIGSLPTAYLLVVTMTVVARHVEL